MTCRDAVLAETDGQGGGVGGQMALEYVLVTPARNEAALIEQTIQSVISQTILPKRWVIVSDGSTDDTDRIVETYQRFYPLLQQAYVSLGYPDGYFNDRVVEVIDHLLATPQPEEPILLIRPHVLYQYADADLEALSSGQKLLIRTGSNNTASIKQFLGELRARIAIGN